MKFILTLLLAGITMSVFAQSAPGTIPAVDSTALLQETATAPIANKPLSSYPKNVVKMNVSSLVLNSYNFYYERMLTRKISITGGFKTMPRTGLSSTTIGEKLVDQLDIDRDDQDDIDRLEASSNAFTLGVRFYTGKRPGAKGFYAELYGRYTNLKAYYAYDYTSSSDKNYKFPIEVSTNGFGGGLLLGGQFNIAKKVVVDLYIIGAHYGKLNGDANAITDLSSMTAQERQDMQDDINDLAPSFNDKKMLQVNVTESGVRGNVDGPFLGVRAAGLSIGWTF
ncbi:MAG: hypothetical protein P0Y53_25575 [Candidatus Pseudobacter hemicellulosilyticus]|uniref:DUF3575 domain-containing protein n=1 Tax=Candidatus Pseudobacter hemicellulosilyticus TaxID=3121375 RepID=A0AAJ6BFP2_9BACT|nr:MAG: hypothetical protein P0Y53_25575 [Pseudobacter sp.]